MEGDGVRRVMRERASRDEKFGVHSKCDGKLEPGFSDMLSLKCSWDIQEKCSRQLNI